MTLLLAAVTWSLGTTRSRAAALAEEMTAEARESAKRAALVVATAPDAVVSIDDRGVITEWNDQAERMFGWARAEVIGRPLVETIVPPSQRAAHAAGFARHLEDGGPGRLGRRIEVQAVRRDRRKIPVEYSVAAFTRRGRRMFSAFFRDITSQIEAQAAAKAHLDYLIEARDQAQAATRAKSDFLAVMSHEIRTPMNGILGMTSLLLQTELDEEQSDFARAVQESAEALLAILNDVLDFSKIEAGKMTFAAVPFDLRRTVEDVVELLSPRARQKGLDLVLRWKPGTPARVVADPGRIRQVLVNLAANAVKFTERGHVLVDVSCHGANESGAYFDLRVQDTGIGIAPEDQARLFREFTQADASSTRRHGGTGLGLVISRRLVERMGGEIGVDSRRGEGSTFWVRLRLPLDRAGAPAEETFVDVRGHRALVVDGGGVTRRVIEEQLAAWGFRCDGVDAEPEALVRLREACTSGDPYDVAVVGRLVPGGSCDLAASVRGDAGLGRTRLLRLAPSWQHGDGPRAKEAGFDGYLVAPARAADLFDALAVLCAGPRGPDQPLVTRHSLSEARAEAAHDAVSRPAPAAAGRRVLVVEDNLVNRRVATGLLERMGCRVDTAVDGPEAVARTAAEAYDVVFMDVQMPGMDGFEATAAIRSGPNGRVPVVAMTAATAPEDRARCLDAGMDDYLGKPIRVEDLARVLDRWAGADGRRPASFDREAALRYLGGSLDLLREVGAAALVELPAGLQRLRAAAERGDREAVAAEAHGLKGMLATLGGGEVASRAADAERAARGADADGLGRAVGDLTPAVEAFVRALADDLLRASATSAPARGGGPGSAPGDAPA